MPGISKIITLNDGASADKLEEAKKQVRDKGGKITHEFNLIKGFSAEFPADAVSTMESNEYISVEDDKEVTTQ